MHREAGGERAVLSKTLTAVLLAVFQVPAVGTAQVPEGSDGEAADKLEEVIVTARKRTENIQNVPISVQAVGGQALVERNLDSLADLAETVPGVHIGVGARSDDLYIRGIGSGNNQSFDQSVGTFIDDIYHGRSRESTAAFLDLDRVEILKGPQSTFFGNNAIAGAFNVITRKPTSDFDGSIRALYGQDGQYAVEGAAGGPIVADKLAVRAAAIWDGMNGWLENQGGQHVPGERNEAGRLTLLFTPSDDLEATLKTEGGSNRNRGWVPYQLADCPPPAPFTAAGFCTTALRSTVPIGLDNSRTSSSVGQGTNLDTFEEVLTVAYTHWDHTFTSVTGYYSYRYNSDLDTDGLPEALFNARIPERYNQFSQEFRITSPAGKLFEYMGGLYYQRDRLSVSQQFDYFFLSPTVGSKASLAPLVPYLPLGQETDFSQPERTRAVFGSLSWNLTDRLKLSTGLRGSWVDKSIDWRLYYGTATQTYGGVVALPASVTPLAAALGLGAPGTADETRSDSAWTPSANIQYRLDGRKMIYFSYAQGFKAGGFNGVDNTGNPASLPFAPEHVNAYEAGLKSQWLDDRLVLNLDVFRSNYRNLQVSANELTAAGTF
ncbi:MAG TPA: TonB-dependent receptor, partial [Steroidobacteraceae bacterium]|nr:TonB-dependent receptor [Steroidobacteraceae bacterium]